MGNFFISVGPLILGSAAIFLSLRFIAGLPLSWSAMVDEGRSVAPAGDLSAWAAQFFSFLKTMAAKIYENVDWGHWRTYLAAYLVLSVGSAMTLSRRDISSASGGLGVTLLLLFAVNLLFAVFGTASLNAAPFVPWAASDHAPGPFFLYACCARFPRADHFNRPLRVPAERSGSRWAFPRYATSLSRF